MTLRKMIARKLIAIGIAAFIVVTIWVPVIRRMRSPSEEDNLRKYLQLAETQCERGAYGSAVKCYQRAVELKDTEEHRLLLADALRLYGDPVRYVDALREITRCYPESPKAYEALAGYYFALGQYSECVSVVMLADACGVSSGDLRECFERSARQFTISDERYDDAGCFRNGYAVVRRDNRSYLLSERMKLLSKEGYDCADAFIGLTAAVTVGNESYFIDKKGAKYLVPAGLYLRLYSYADGRAAAEWTGGGGYLNQYGEPVLDEYEYASSFSEGVAAVKQDGRWRLINASGDPASSGEYDQILLQEDNHIGCGGRAFVRINGTVRMIDISGKASGDMTYEDARPFEDGSLAAVKAGGVWGFADRSGNLQIAPQYEDARSFRMGLAAVKKEGAWGFINEKNELVIECLFQDAKCFSDGWKAPVKMSDGWTYITLVVKGALDGEKG